MLQLSNCQNTQPASIQDYIMLPVENDFDVRLLHLTSTDLFKHRYNLLKVGK